MNELIKVENGEVYVDSRMIAEHFGKAHSDVLKDIRDEESKIGEGVFSLSTYTSEQNKQLPCYTMGEDGALQLAARYDAVSRRKLIVILKEARQSKPALSSLEILELQLKAMKEQEQKLIAIETKVDRQEQLFSEFREHIIEQPDDWREGIVKKVMACYKKLGGHHNAWVEFYKEFERRSGSRLDIKLDNARIRLERLGVSKTKVKQLNRLDIISEDKRLKEIATFIAKEFYLKFKEN